MSSSTTVKSATKRQSRYRKSIIATGKSEGTSSHDALTIVDTEHMDRDILSLCPSQKLAFTLLPYIAAASLLMFLYVTWLQYSTALKTESWEAAIAQRNLFPTRKKHFMPVVYSIIMLREHLELFFDFVGFYLGGTSRIARPRLRLLGSSVPAVDVVIVCCKESIDVIRDTVLAALATDYPDDAFRLVVSDDGADDEVRRFVGELKVEYPKRRVYYVAREKTLESSHKAGNLNHALRFVAMLPGGPAPFFSGLDADMIVDRGWLRASMAHLVRDEKMGFVCLPPLAYNVPTNDPLGQSQLYLQTIEKRAKDAVGLAECTGSGWTMRRAALDQIGGFPADALTEDMLCGMLILGRGWKSAFVAEALQWGLVPESYHAHVKQQSRWSTGELQVGLVTKFGLFGEQSRHLGPWQRIYACLHPLKALLQTISLLEMVGGMLLLLADAPRVVFSNTSECKLLLRAEILAFLAIVPLRHLLVGTILGGKVSAQGAVSSIRMLSSKRILTPYRVLNHSRHFLLPHALGGPSSIFTARFTATGSIKDLLHERSLTVRAPLLSRMKSVLFYDLGIMHLLMAVGYLSGVVLTFTRGYTRYAIDSTGFYLFLLTRLFWVAPAWPYMILNLLQPLIYAIWPPSVPERETLLVRDNRGVPRPKDEAKRIKLTGIGLGAEAICTVNMLFAVALFIGTWFW